METRIHAATLIATVQLLLISCTQKEAAAPTVSSAIEGQARMVSRQYDRPARGPAVIVPPAPKPKRAPEVRSAPRKEDLRRFVSLGTLSAKSEDSLIFSKPDSGERASSGLFEDAILLARLRRQLKQDADVPEFIRATANVHNAVAYLRIDDVPAKTAGRAIDSALGTRGIVAVSVRDAVN